MAFEEFLQSRYYTWKCSCSWSHCLITFTTVRSHYPLSKSLPSSTGHTAELSGDVISIATSASFKSFLLALISAVAAGAQHLLMIYYVGKKGKLQSLLLGPYYQNGPHSIGQRANVEILSVAKYVYSNYMFSNWGNNYRVDPQNEWAQSPSDLS